MAGYNNDLDYQVSQYAVVTGGANNVLNSVLPSSSGTVLTSNGVSAQPSFQAIAYQGFTWTATSATSQACLVTNGYVTTAATQATMYLPATASVGNEIKFSNIGAGFTIQPAYGQTLSFLSDTATYPSNINTTTANAAADLICTNNNTSWNVINNEGTFTQGIITSLLNGSFSNTDVVYLKYNGSAWGAGQNSFGELGNQTLNSYSSPISVVGAMSFIQIVTCDDTTLALRGDNTCWAWGNNTAGQLGNLSTTSTSSPISVVGGFLFTQVLSGGSGNFGYGVGLQSTGVVRAWGINIQGQLGNLTVTSYSSPVSVVGNHSFIQIAVGLNSVYGLKIDGSCWGWGLNTQGQMGNQTSGNSFSSPVSVVGNHSFIQIQGGKTCAYGLKIDGSCWAWGGNATGQLAQQNATSYSSPVSVVGNHSFIQISSGGANDCYALKANGQIWCWGSNASGQLGQQNVTSYSSPVSVVGPFSFVKIANAAQDNLGQTIGAWLANGQLWAWGMNSYGNLGNNTRTSYSSPILVLNTP